ncbi:MAG: hypothetical protein NXI31_05350 [bacterium]|nr:hypothetical protein [bacterium]
MAAAIVVGLLLTGCQGLPRGKDGVTAVQFRDMVVPDGLHVVDNAHQSHSVEAASWRMGRFVYTGKVRAEEAASYVRQRMPLHSWKLVQETKPQPTQTRLRYERGYYSAEYTFTRRGGHTQLVVDYTTEYPER